MCSDISSGFYNTLVVVRMLLRMLYPSDVCNICVCEILYNKIKIRILEMPVCIVPKCTVVYSSEVRGFSFPRHPDERAKWCDLIGINDAALTTNHRVCQHHFEPEFIIKSDVKILDTGKY